MNIQRELARCRLAHRLQCSDAPDMTAANTAATKSAQLSEEQLAWAKDIYNQEAPARAEARGRANAVSDQQLSTAQFQDGLAREGAAHYRDTFQPLETRLATEAAGYATPGRMDKAAGDAMANVDTQATAARDATMRDMAARGVDPSSGSAAIALSRGGIQEAAARAAAGNTARTNVENIGYGRMMDAVGVGRGVITNQGTTAGIGTTAGNASVGNTITGLNAGTAGSGQVAQGYGTAINGLNTTANTLTNVGKVQADVSASNTAGLGSLAGAGMMAFAI